MLRVRFRIDGVLYEIMQPPLKLKNAITSRIKVMASLDIAERRLPQDGRIKLKLARLEGDGFPRLGAADDLRREGRAASARQVEPAARHDEARLRGEGAQGLQGRDLTPYGMVLVTGPTGSGKTTTLYSALSELNKITANISTAEDPVEFNLVGINQVQMHEDIGLNFAAALRSFLRQDPDIIMVGEIRDFETAEIGVKAALTGHLVLSTLHTNDAPSTINRLLNMGVEPFLVASSINLILAQRLAARDLRALQGRDRRSSRRRCSRSAFDPAEVDDLRFFHGTGCANCSGTGFKGRIALYEVHADERRDPRSRSRRRLGARDQAHGSVARHEDAAPERDQQGRRGRDDGRGGRPRHHARLSECVVVTTSFDAQRRNAGSLFRPHGAPTVAETFLQDHDREAGRPTCTSRQTARR